MEASQTVPAEVQQVADSLGVPVESLLAGVAAAQAQAAAQPPAEQPAGGLTGASSVSVEPVEQVPAEVAEGVTAVPVETNEQRLEREKAVLAQELQQTRDLARTAEEGRVIGSGGQGHPGAPEEKPNLGSIEPGIRFAYANGLITDEQLETQVGPLLADLLKAHKGGAI